MTQKRTALEILDAFWSQVTKTEACWVWTGLKHPRGYGYFWAARRNVLAHRWSYQQQRGAIPNGLTLDHLCRNKLCVNPDHLEPVTLRVNILRSDGVTAIHARKTHCPQGHPYSGANLLIGARNGRRCRICKLSDDRSRRLKRKLAKLEER